MKRQRQKKAGSWKDRAKRYGYVAGCTLFWGYQAILGMHVYSHKVVLAVHSEALDLIGTRVLGIGLFLTHFVEAMGR